MRKRFATVLLAMFGAVTSAEPTTQPTIQPEGPVQEYIDRVPATLARDAFKSYDVIATVGSDQSPFIIRVRKTEAGHCCLYATCTKRRVPIFFSSDREALQYDPALGVLRRFHNANVQLSVRSKEGTFTTDFNLHFQEKAATQPAVPIEPNFDFRSLVESAPHNVSAKTVDEFQVITGHTMRGNPADFWFDPKRKYPLAAMELYDGNEPFFTFARIELNQPVDDRNMALPSDNDLAAILPIKEIDGVFSMAAWQAGLALSVMYELAIEDPQRRPAVEAKLGKIDWEKRIAADAEVNRRLIKLIGEQVPADGLSKK